jgi:hypothetical protein
MNLRRGCLNNGGAEVYAVSRTLADLERVAEEIRCEGGALCSIGLRRYRS